MRRIMKAALVLLFVCLTNVYGWSREHINGYSLSKQVETNQLIVVGRVSGKEFVTRANITANFTTDITVSVDTVVKGNPNLGTDRVKFMIRGGQGLDPLTGKPIGMRRSDQPDFELGEKVLLFLTNGASNEPDDARRPHDRYRVSWAKYGKRLVVDDKVFIDYPASDTPNDYTMKGVHMPLDLAVELGKALVRNKEAAIPLENQIKNLVKTSDDFTIKLSEATVTNLISSAKAIEAPPAEDN